jgi:hypothetical protein
MLKSKRITNDVGAAALLLTPREEEPQIVVPLADVMVMYPGGSAQEVEQLVSSLLERMLYQIDGVEYVYSMSRPGLAVVTVRFFVGQDREGSLIKLYNKIFQNIDKTTPGIAGWVVKPIEIDDVPIINVALYSDRYDEHALYRAGEEVVAQLQRISNTGNINTDWKAWGPRFSFAYQIDKKTYSFHYQDRYSQLLFRYDNALHKPALGFDDHKHIGSEILPAEVPNLRDILGEIITGYFARY